MNPDLLIQFEILLVTVGVGLAGFFAHILKGISNRIDKLDASVGKIHARIDEVKDGGHNEHKKIGERLTRIETVLKIKLEGEEG